MTRTMQTSTDVGGSSQVTKPGTYHCVITHAADGETTTGKPQSCCSAILSVLDGTESDQVEKEFHLHLFDPDRSKDESKQEWPRKKQTAYAIAINQLDPANLGQSVSLDFGSAEGQQVVVGIEENEYNGKTNLQLAWANIYHVDDPRAKDIPKSKEALATLPKECRKSADFFAPLLNKRKPAENRLSDDDINDL